MGSEPEGGRDMLSIWTWLRGLPAWVIGKLSGPPSMGAGSVKERLESLTPQDYIFVRLHKSSGNHAFEGRVVDETRIRVRSDTVFMDRLQKYNRSGSVSFSFPLRAIHWIKVSHGTIDS